MKTKYWYYKSCRIVFRSVGTDVFFEPDYYTEADGDKSRLSLADWLTGPCPLVPLTEGQYCVWKFLGEPLPASIINDNIQPAS